MYRFNPFIRFILGCLASLFITSCSFSPAKVPPMTTYTLDQLPYIQASKHPSEKILLVTAPSANAGYKNKQMVYSDQAHTLKHFSQNTWIEPPAQLLQPLLVHSLLQTNHFRAVVATPYTGRSDIRLEARLVKLQQNFSVQPSEIILAINVRLMNTKNSEVIASQLFQIAVTTPQNSPDGGALAANQAVAQLLRQITVFVIDSL